MVTIWADSSMEAAEMTGSLRLLREKQDNKLKNISTTLKSNYRILNAL